MKTIETKAKRHRPIHPFKYGQFFAHRKMLLPRDSFDLCVDLQRWWNVNQFGYGSRPKQMHLQDLSVRCIAAIELARALVESKMICFRINAAAAAYSCLDASAAFNQPLESAASQHFVCVVVRARNQVCSKRAAGWSIWLFAHVHVLARSFNIQWQFIKIIRQKCVADVDRARTRLLYTQFFRCALLLVCWLLNIVLS